MNKEEFEQAFAAMVTQRLAPLGFRAAGRSLHAYIGDAEIGLMRLGGRMAVHGAVAHVLCGRKAWLRTRQETVPEKFVHEVFDHPFKVQPSKVCAGKALAYVPSNLDYSYDVLRFEAETDASVIRELARVRDAVEVFSGWLAALPADSLLKQLRTRGEKAWIERIWIEDCEARAEK